MERRRRGSQRQKAERKQLLIIMRQFEKKVLVVLKTSRLARMQRSHNTFKPQSGKLVERLTKAHETHQAASVRFIEKLQKIYGGDKQVEVTRDLSLEKGTKLSPKDYQYVFSVGGDGTLVRVASFLDNGDLPLVGVCSDGNKGPGKLTSMSVNQDMSDEKLEAQLLQLYNNQVKFQDHSRLEVDVIRGDGRQTEQYLALNEAFVADSHPATSTRSVILVDNKEPSKEFCSSGVIVSTGTGSTGWLSSALYLSPQEVHSIFAKLPDKSIRSIDNCKQAATLHNEQISFPVDSNKMFFYVREPTPRDRERNEFSDYQGFIEKQISIWNQSYRPMLFLDGVNEVSLGLEDQVDIRINREKDIQTPRLD